MENCVSDLFQLQYQVLFGSWIPEGFSQYNMQIMEMGRGAGYMKKASCFLSKKRELVFSFPVIMSVASIFFSSVLHSLRGFIWFWENHRQRSGTFWDAADLLCPYGMDTRIAWHLFLKYAPPAHSMLPFSPFVMSPLLHIYFTKKISPYALPLTHSSFQTPPNVLNYSNNHEYATQRHFQILVLRESIQTNITIQLPWGWLYRNICWSHPVSKQRMENEITCHKIFILNTS